MPPRDQRGRKKKKIKKAKDPTFRIDEVGAIGTEIFNKLHEGMIDLKPISGTIRIKVLLKLEDVNWFGDDKTRQSEVEYFINLGPRKEPM